MEMYVFEDARLADELRSAGIPVIKTFHTGKEMFAVADKPEYSKYLITHYGDLALRKTGTVCF